MSWLAALAGSGAGAAATGTATGATGAAVAPAAAPSIGSSFGLGGSGSVGAMGATPMASPAMVDPNMVTPNWADKISAADSAMNQAIDDYTFAKERGYLSSGKGMPQMPSLPSVQFANGNQPESTSDRYRNLYMQYARR